MVRRERGLVAFNSGSKCVVGSGGRDEVVKREDNDCIVGWLCHPHPQSYSTQFILHVHTKACFTTLVIAGN